MPELPEVERVRRDLSDLLPGRRIVSAWCGRPELLVPATETSAPGSVRLAARRASGRHAAAAGDLLVGSAIVRIERRGKQLAWIGKRPDGTQPVLLAQLGMTGEFVVKPDRKALDALDHVHIGWRLSALSNQKQDTWLGFRDPRRFGGLRALPDPESLATHWAALGPDALSITPQALLGGVERSARAVKAILLDQRVVAGVGNIYADEALHLARIDPRTPGRALPAGSVARLAEAIRFVLEASLEQGGSTIRSYAGMNGVPGRAQLTHRVYGRGGEACVACGQPLQSARLAQRATVWCGQCQRTQQP